ncbi:MAG: mercury methylation corrinoid protein HgcA [bacterium]
MGNNCGCNSENKIRDTLAKTKQPSCCGTTPFSAVTNRDKAIKADWVIEHKDTKIGRIPIISARLSRKDMVDGWKARWGLNRMNYRIEPGLYGIGNPDESSPVLVTANYKLTFDKVRKELDGFNGWILILDTKGINVWCAAGKGTFGTAELIHRLTLTKLALLVNHRTLILPQLGAVGVAAHEITKATGFNVIYGPVLARDIKVFIENNYQKTAPMRTVYFPLAARMAVAPIEIMHSLKLLLLMFVIIGIFSAIENKTLTFMAITDFLPFLGAVITGTVIFPALLPYLPFRSFAVKGYILGILYTAAVIFFMHPGSWGITFYFLVLPALVSFLTLNFTGASTYTSLTGTKIEVSTSLPVFAVLGIAGILVRILILVRYLA